MHSAWLKVPEDYLQDIYGQEDRVHSWSYSAFPQLEADFVLRLCRLRNTQAVQDLHV